MSDNIHPEIVELRHRVMQLESQLERAIDPLNCSRDRTVHVPSITRFELIDESGRVKVYRNSEVSLSFQDGGRTLKAFVDPRYGN